MLSTSKFFFAIKQDFECKTSNEDLCFDVISSIIDDHQGALKIKYDITSPNTWKCEYHKWIFDNLLRT